MNDIRKINLKNKNVLIRTDFNVPLNQGVLIDNFRIKEALPTINYCLSKGASITLMSHLGRPNGEIVQSLSLDPIAFALEELLDKEVMFSNDCISEDAISLSSQLLPGEIHLLENLRFYKEEMSNDNEFARKLAQHGDIFINDAFGTSHRTHASNVGVAKLIKNNCMGLLVEKELKYLDFTLKNPESPFTVILGGAKVHDKIPFIDNMLKKADSILIGGAMAFTFLKAIDKNIGSSLIDENSISFAKNIIENAKDNNTEIILPVDVVSSHKLSDNSTWRISSLDDLKDTESGYDIGPETSMNFQMIISKAKTIIWNGPLGVSEIPEFSTGTQAVASAVMDQTKEGATSIIGGGDTASALNQYGLKEGFSHTSTGGGASLHLLSGNTLPAIEVLN